MADDPVSTQPEDDGPVLQQARDRLRPRTGDDAPQRQRALAELAKAVERGDEAAAAELLNFLGQ